VISSVVNGVAWKFGACNLMQRRESDGAADNPASDTVVIASLPAARRLRPLARCRGRSAGEEEGAYRQGKLHAFVTIDRTSKFASLNCTKANAAISREFLLRARSSPRPVLETRLSR
jgi:hypothetical protein